MATNDTTARPTETAPRAPRAPRARRAARTRRAASARSAARRSASAPRTRVGTTTEPVAVTPIAQAQQLAERIVLIPVGAALEARDLVADAFEGVVSASTGALDELRAATSSRSALDRRLKRFERRGGRARIELERDLRRTRTRIEREVRQHRVAPVRQRVAPLTDRVAPVRSRVERVVQNGLGAGRRFVEDAQDRIAKVA
ncbi:hypothetical protein [Conexibacter arvalis]|uniref:Uncharacterized protein n=1 Tax=Conexibacter arvalis TaxID=912552 RepID=A0A840IAN0_9ACTN|nr:hypothetical protein [Conexibacter arvalis]MBB4661174.1 hypothetical protein [Conexibacter arvalis]